jgi:hypothetical protein
MSYVIVQLIMLIVQVINKYTYAGTASSISKDHFVSVHDRRTLWAWAILCKVRSDTTLGLCRDFYRFVLWNLSVRITILSGRTVKSICVRITILSGRTMKSISSYHISIGTYCEIYRFISQFDRAVLWNLSVRITILSGRTVKSIGSYHYSIGAYCEIYRFISQFYRAILWNLLVRITILSGRTVKSIGSYHNSIGSYHLFVVFWTIAIGNLHFGCPRNPTTCKDADHYLGKAHTAYRFVS